MAAVHASVLAALLLVLVCGLPVFAVVEPSAVSAESKPIRKVITLLEEMKMQVEKEAEEDLEAYDKYMCWCETNRKEKTAAIETAEQRISELATFLEESVAKEGELKTEIAGLEADISEDSDALASATGVREKDLQAFHDEEADMKETISLLGEAVKVLEKVQLLQKKGSAEKEVQQAAAALVQVSSIVQRRFPRFEGIMQRDLFDMLGSLKGVPHAEAFLPRRGAAALAQKRLLPWDKTAEQVGKEANPNGLVGNTAGAKSYNARSGSILGIMAEMKDEFARDLGEAQKKDLEKEIEFQNLRAAKLAEIAAATEQKKAKEAELADVLDKAAKAKEDKEATEAAMDADQKFLATLEKTCKEEDEEYNGRVKVRTQEIQALGEALKILTEDSARDLYAKTMTFMQIGEASKVASQDRALERSMQRIAAVARKNGDWALASLAVRMQLDAFTKVKEMLDKMLAELNKQQAEEYEKWEFCKKEIDTTEDSIKEGELTKADLDEKHKALSDTIISLEKDIEDLKADVEAMEVSLKQAGEERKAQNLLFQTSVSDQRATINILNKANARLKEFYGFAQVEIHAHVQDRQVPGAPAPPPPPSPQAYQKSAGAGGVLQLLAKIIEDAEIAEQEFEMTEQKSQQDYAAFVQDATNSIDTDRSSIQTKEGEVADAKASLSETEQAQVGNDVELSRLQDLLKARHLECDYIIKYFDIRQQARAEEMDSIKDAKAILSGADFGK